MITKIFSAIRSMGLPALPELAPASDHNPTVVRMSSSLGEKPIGQVKYRNFTAARTDRFTASWLSSDIAINALLQSQLAIMRARSRYLTRNTSPGRRFMTLVKNNVIGPDGIRLQSRCGDTYTEAGKQVWKLDSVANDAIEAHFKIWSRKEHCDATGQFGLEELCRMWAGCIAQDGEILIKEVIGTKKTPYRYQLQTLAIDRLDINYNGTAENGNTIRMGIEREESGKPVACYVLLRNPNDSLSLGLRKHERIATTEVIHRFVPVDPEQIRGFPWSHAVMSGEKMLQMFQDAALGASIVGASNMGFYVPPAPGEAGWVSPTDDNPDPAAAAVADGVDAEGRLIKDAVGGAFEVLPAGYDFKTFNPAYPHAAYQPFVQESKRDLAVGLDVAHHNLSGDMTGVNYSSARIAELQERDTWRAMQKFFLNNVFRHIAERWLDLSLLAGAITTQYGSALPATKVDKFKAGLTFVPRGWDWVDPKNEITAAIDAIDNGLTTRSKVVASKGGDFEENIIELAREAELIKQYGISLGQANKPNPTNQTDSPI
jgi:lambda family phage portal protein